MIQAVLCLCPVEAGTRLLETVKKSKEISHPSMYQVLHLHSLRKKRGKEFILKYVIHINDITNIITIIAYPKES